ncbi:choice-of-anchor A domain protein [Clostridium baratii str. Sullivan]|uniref:Choice-of-anchor A domain protein n=1 Tax=Clostridium baratii str. Sullivan TaxID=1415775 RepID=A0A0A7FWN6_9CLOT|nr:SpaA isopeptide-forming pilin-related protein [Clostridium baratii]AIY84032.1 choice-of-anchor A domain protein [Clostridium baratii str. Sullivan]
MKRDKRLKFRKTLAMLTAISLIIGNILPVKEVVALTKGTLDNLGGLNHYNSIVFGNHTATKADTEGAIAVQGDFIVNEAFSVPASATGADNLMGATYIENGSPSVLIGKNYISNNSNLDVLADTIVVSNKETKEKLSKIPSHTNLGQYVNCEIKPIDEIENTFAEMRQTVDNATNQASMYNTESIDSKTLADLYIPGDKLEVGHPGEKNGQWGFGRDKNNQNVFISSGLTGGKDNIIIKDVKIPEVNDNEFVVIYSDAKDIEFTSAGIEYLGQAEEAGDLNYGVVDTSKPQNKTLYKLASKVIWMFPNATNVYIGGKGIVGSIIAPNAYVDTKGGSVNGQLVAGGLNQFGGFECHNFFFNWGDFFSLAKGEVKLNKIGENNEPLEGAEFGLFRKSDDALIQTVISDKEGNVKFTDIEAGIYYVKEIKAPKGYELSNEFYDVVIESGKANKIDLKEVVNKIIKGNALLYKVDDQNNPLQGAVFGVYKEDGTKISEVISDKDGKVEVLDLYPGRYYLQEISAPDGYELDSNSKYEFEIVLGSKDTVLIQEDPVVNTFKGGQAKLLKLHDGNDALEMAEFGVYREESNELVKVITSDKDGIIEIKGLAAGKYYFKEMKAPEGYEIDENKYPFEIKIGEMTVVDAGESINVFIGGSVKLKKVDTLGNSLEGAIFELYKDNNGSWDKQEGTYTSDKDGIVKVKGLKVGKYYLKEVKSPDGYLLSDKQYPFEITRGSNVTIDLGNVENIFVNGYVKLEKVDEENKPLSGAIFGLYGTSDSLIKEVESDENGIVKVTDLEPGDYYLKEIKSPDGYKLDETKYNFTIISGKNETVYAGKHVNIFNGGSAELLKVDEKNNALEGAEFTLYKKVNGEWKKQDGIYTSNKYGVVKVNGLGFGDYYLQETKAPTGYELSNKKYEFKIEIGNTTTINVGKAVNTLSKGSVKLKK